jgi:hypothetical protein
MSSPPQAIIVELASPSGHAAALERISVQCLAMLLLNRTQHTAACCS